MKVLMVASDNNLTSGAFRSMARLAKHLREDFLVEVTVALPEQGRGTELLDEYQIPYIYLKSYDWVVSLHPTFKRRVKYQLRFFLNRYYYARKIRKTLKEFAPDIVHINTSYTYLVAQEAQKLNIKVVWHLREFLEEDQWRRFYYRKKSIALIGKSEYVIAISDSIRQKYVDDFRQKIVTIYNGLDTEEFLTDRRILDGEIRFLCMGRIRHTKGQLCVIRAIGELYQSNRISDFSVKLYGAISDEMKAELDGVIEEYVLEDKVHYCGTTDKPADAYKEADILFVNSEKEPFGRVTVEGMLSGCLIIGANSAGTAEIVDDNITGLLHQYNNVPEIKEAILEALSDIELSNEIAKRGQTVALEKFSSLTNARNIFELYQKIQKQ